MKRILIYAITAVTAAALWSCADDASVPRSRASVTIDIQGDIEGLNIESETLTFRNLSSGVSTTFDTTDAVELPVGLYECSYSADVTYTNKGSEETVTAGGKLVGNAESVRVVDQDVTLSLPVYLVADNDDFIFEEIFYTGTRRPTGSSYLGDTYYKIYNNTDHVLYADGVAFVESKFLTVNFYEYTPDIRNEAMTVQAIYVIPGSGKDYPVQPGESITVCDMAIDHTVSNSNSFDLTGADFEWYDESTVPSVTDVDNPDVPNMDRWYCSSRSVFVLHNQGYVSFALARIPIDKEEYLRDYWYTYNYTIYTASGTFPMEGSAYKLPNSWIIDGVNCSVEAKRQWNVLPASVDAGWTWCATIASDNNRFFKSVRRKMLYLTDDGRRVLKDTNNSTNDFNSAVVPSIVEEQGTAVNANGEKSTTRTYDGVQLMK